MPWSNYLAVCEKKKTENISGSEDEEEEDEAGGNQARASKKKEKKRQEREAQRQVRVLSLLQVRIEDDQFLEYQLTSF